MAATVQIVRLTGATPTVTDITSINTRANAEDAHSTAGTTNPIQIPAVGSGLTNYSFKVSTQLNAVTSPATAINNVRWYSDGANGFGTGVGCNAKAVSAYSQASGTPGTSGDQMTGGSNAFGYTSASPLAVTGTLANPTTGRFGYVVEYQISVSELASPGPTPTETFTFKYDES